MTRKLVALGVVVTVVAIGTIGLMGRQTAACPFCAAQALTFTEEIAAAEVAVIATLGSGSGDGGSGPITPDDEPKKSKFKVLSVLKGDKHLGGRGEIESVYFGEAKAGTPFLLLAIEPPKLIWNTPVQLSDRGVKYLGQIVKLPKEGSDRLKFFYDYLEDKDEQLARDAFDEFAKAPYKSVKEFKAGIKHDQLVKWIKDDGIPTSRRRLYFTLLGVSGGKDDLAMLEKMIKSDDRKDKAGLDALIACYLTLRGKEGVPLVEDLFLKNDKADYTETYSAIMALRFLGQEQDIISKERVLEALRHMLNRPQLADLIIPDLARWEDWSAMPQLVKLFKDATDDTIFVRVPVINYLRACPKPEAKKHLAELEKLDPESFKRADSFFPFGAPVPAADSTKKGSDAKSGDAKNGDAKGKDNGTKPADKKTPDKKTTDKKQASAEEADRDASVTVAPAPPIKNATAWVVGVPIAVVPALMLAMWLILRGPQRGNSGERGPLGP